MMAQKQWCVSPEILPLQAAIDCVVRLLSFMGGTKCLDRSAVLHWSLNES